MEIHLKINDVVGMDDEKRHILRVDDESLREALLAHPGWITQCVVKDFLLKHNTRLLNEILDDPTLRNNIYMDEKAKREQKAERRERHRPSTWTRKPSVSRKQNDVSGIVKTR